MKLLVSCLFVVFSLNSFATQTKFNRVVVFGDSLSDVGTYAPVAYFQGGGKFTTNPGKLWVENISDYLGLPMKPNRHEGFGIPFVKLGGYNFAQGGAKLVESVHPSSRYSARPVTTQLDYFLTDHFQFNAGDIVFIQGGANDILAQLRAVSDKSITTEQAVQNIIQTANDFVSIISKVQSHGAKSVVILNLPMVQKAPKILGRSPEVQAFTAHLVNVFNSNLAAQTLVLNVLLVDLHSFDQHFNDNYLAYGFINIDQEACDSSGVVGGIALFCSGESLVGPGADQNHKFADDLHPSTGFSRVAGEYVWGVVKTWYGVE